MSFLVTKSESDRFLEVQTQDAWLHELWMVMQKRTRLNTQELSVCQSQDTQNGGIWSGTACRCGFVLPCLEDVKVAVGFILHPGHLP